MNSTATPEPATADEVMQEVSDAVMRRIVNGIVKVAWEEEGGNRKTAS